MKLTPMALWVRRTSSGPGAPISTCSKVRTSGPPVRAKRMARAFMSGLPGSVQLLFEEGGGAPVGEGGCRLVPMLAAAAREGVVDARIRVQCHHGIALEAAGDLRPGLIGAELVGLGHMEHQRLGDRRRLVQQPLDADRV